MQVATVSVNNTLDWSRGKRAAHVAHAVLHLHGIFYTHPVVVLNAKAREVDGHSTAATLHDTDGRAVASAEWGDNGALVIRVVVTRAKSRDDTAIAAARVALDAYHKPDCKVFVREAFPSEIEAHDLPIRDQGRTELPRGTLTAAAKFVSDPADDPTGTLRRVVTNWGFGHVIALSQSDGSPRWLVIDAYGPMTELGTDLLTDDAVVHMERVYVPVDDKEWASSHGLNPNPDPGAEPSQIRSG